MKVFSVLALALVAGAISGVHAETTMKRSLNANENDPNAPEIGNMHKYIEELKQEYEKANMGASNSQTRRLRRANENDPNAPEIGNMHKYIEELKQEYEKASLSNSNVVAMESQKEFSKKTNAPDAGW